MIAVDTNILIYAHDRRDPAKMNTAIALLDSLTDGVLLWQVACEFIAASRKLERQGFTAAEAWARLREFLDVCPLATPSGHSVLNRAKNLHLAHQVSFWDAMILSACLDAGVTVSCLKTFLVAKSAHLSGEPLQLSSRSPVQ